MSYYENNEAGPSTNKVTKHKFLPPVPDDDDFDIANATPIFSKRKINIRLPTNYVGCDFMHIAVCKNWLVCLLESPPSAKAPQNATTFLRFFMPRALPPGEISLDKYLAGYKISKLFLDHTGHHTLVSLVPNTPGLSADFLYIHGNGPKVRRIEKFKDHEITAVAFNSYLGTEASTGPILLGTTKGLIFETELTQDADKPSYRKQVYDLGLGRPKYVINDLKLLQVPNANKYIITTSVNDNIYTFQDTLKPEDKSLQSIFNSYVNGSQEAAVIEVKTELNFSVLRFYASPNEKFPLKWAWLCGSGLRHGEVLVEINSGEQLLKGESCISLDYKQHKHLSIEERRQYLPKSFALTEHHILLMYADHITGICLLSQEVVYEEYFDAKMGELLNIVTDYFTGCIYVYTNKMMFNFKITEEDRHIWRLYLKKGQYDLAEIYAAEQPEHLDQIWIEKANVEYEAKNYKEAARIYAQTTKPFEEISLLFITLEDKSPLITYVKLRLQSLPDSADCEDQLKVLVIWLVDLYLTEINMPQKSAEEKAKWQAEYNDFMRGERVAKCTAQHRTDIQDLLKQHADAHNLAEFAIANGDFDEVIRQQISAGKHKDALRTLHQQRNVELFYKHCPILIEYLPHETVEVLINQGRKLDIKELFPTLLTIDGPDHIKEIIKYLEYAIYNLGETYETIHNYLLRLYCAHKPSKVISYLENQGHDTTLIHYDINGALNVCLKADLKDACIFLYCLLEMWPTAVEMALKYNMQLAKETASKPSDEETKRKLWLRIAHSEIKATNDVKKALDLLKECDLLRIEDLLPFFSDFEKIDDFKEPICAALKDYNQKIQELQHDMQECTKQAERVRNDLVNVRQRSVRIGAHELCSICESLLLVKPFFMFGCGHKFHTDCLEKQVIPLLSSDMSRKLSMLKQQLESLLTQSIALTESSTTQQRRRQELKKEIEEIVANDCLYCGLMIETIDQPFVKDWDQDNVAWE